MGIELLVENKPQDSGVFKIVQLALERKNLLLFGANGADEDTHSEILRRFLEAHKIPFRPLSEHPDRPEPRGKCYSAVGMGYAELTDDLRSITFYGSSAGYNIGLDKKKLAAFNSHLSPWKVVIE